jgi:hypothetical protein
MFFIHNSTGGKAGRAIAGPYSTPIVKGFAPSPFSEFLNGSFETGIISCLKKVFSSGH